MENFINKLGNLNIETNSISHALGRGKHTTRHAEIYHINNINIINQQSIFLFKYHLYNIVILSF